MLQKILNKKKLFIMLGCICILVISGVSWATVEEKSKDTTQEVKGQMAAALVGGLLNGNEAVDALVTEMADEIEDLTISANNTVNENNKETESTLSGYKLHYICDEEKRQRINFPEKSTESERYISETGGNDIEIYEKDGEIVFDYGVVRVTTYHGHIVDKQGDILQVELLDTMTDVTMKGTFKPLENHYEFTFTECGDDRFKTLPWTIKFYREEKFSTDGSVIVEIGSIDEEGYTFIACASGTYAEFAEYSTHIHVDYSCMEESFIQDIEKMKGKTALIHYTKYSTTYEFLLYKICFDENEIAQHDEEIYDLAYNEPDSVYANDYFFWSYCVLPNSPTQYEYVKESGQQSNTVFLGIEHVKRFTEGTIFKLYQNNGKENVVLGYLMLHEGKKTYYIDEPEFNIENASYEGILQNAHLVCAMEGVTDKNEGAVGLHETITIVGDTCQYRSFDDNTGKFLNITWTEEYGILRYESGYIGKNDTLVFSKVMPTKTAY